MYGVKKYEFIFLLLFVFFVCLGGLNLGFGFEVDSRLKHGVLSDSRLKPGVLPGVLTMTDPRDNQTYEIKTFTRSVGMDVIVSHTWMIQNLNYDMPDSYCYDDKPENCSKYGRLYTWAAARKACPPGWHLPSDIEWQRLIHQFAEGGLTSNGEKDAYEQLIEDGKSGFAALLGGGRNGSDGEYFSLNRLGYYWSATDDGADRDYYYHFNQDLSELRRHNGYKTSVFSCRCLKD